MPAMQTLEIANADATKFHFCIFREVISPEIGLVLSIDSNSSFEAAKEMWHNIQFTDDPGYLNSMACMRNTIQACNRRSVKKPVWWCPLAEVIYVFEGGHGFSFRVRTLKNLFETTIKLTHTSDVV